jgi:hypothetical protein
LIVLLQVPPYFGFDGQNVLTLQVNCIRSTGSILVNNLGNTYHVFNCSYLQLQFSIDLLSFGCYSYIL